MSSVTTNNFAAVNAASNKTAPASSTSAASDATASLTADYNSFLTLMTAQMKFQDPLKPVDSTQFVSQLAMFAQTEQAVNTNKRLDAISSLVQGQILSGGSDYLGREVEVPGSTVAWDGATTQRFSYIVPDDAKQTKIEIADSTGNTVRRFESSKTAGEHEAVWDGRDDNGLVLPAGDYTVRANVTLPGETSKSADKSEAMTTVTRGTVTEVHNVGGTLALLVNGVKVPVSDVLSVAAKSSAKES